MYLAEAGKSATWSECLAESNNVYALNATTGTLILQRIDIGPSVSSGLPCSNINSVGITGTIFVRNKTDNRVTFELRGVAVNT